MISQVNSSVINNAYGNNFTKSKNISQRGDTHVSNQGNTNKIDRIKESIGNGEYKVNLQALSEKIADGLM